MNADLLHRLEKRNVAGTWFRSVLLRHAGEGLYAPQSRDIATRFSPGNRGSSQYEILYFSEHPEVSLAEKEFLYNVLALSRASTAEQPQPLVTLPVEVDVQDIADLTHPDQADLINTNAQELTGDWRAYGQRTKPYGCTSSTHTDLSPTQRIGQALFECGGFQGLKTFSAVKPDRTNLAIFPERLIGTRSKIRYTYVDQGGLWNQMQIP